VVAVREYYRGKLAEHFLLDGISCILLDDKEPAQVIKEIRYWSEPENHLKMCEAARELFEEYNDFNADYRRFEEWLKKLA
jgi:hypothetical protein